MKVAGVVGVMPSPNDAVLYSTSPIVAVACTR